MCTTSITAKVLNRLILMKLPNTNCGQRGERAERGQRGERGERGEEAIVGDSMLMLMCAFLAVLLQLWSQNFYSCTC